MKLSYQFTIPVKLPSWNQFYSGKHWTKRKCMADDIHNAVLLTIGKWSKPTITRCNIEYIIQYTGNRRHDIDNCMVKLLTDGLVQAGVLKDDNHKIVQSITISIQTGCKEDSVIIKVNV